MTTPSTVLDTWDTIGRHPIQLVCRIDLPGPCHAPDCPEYGARLREALEQGARWGVVLGRCRLCGAGCTRNYVLQSWDRRTSAVCRDCLLARGSKALAKKAAHIDFLKQDITLRLAGEKGFLARTGQEPERTED